ncbi:MAG: ion channel [Opitutales bacterium]
MGDRTLTTVGYRDLHTITTGGRVFTTLIVGVGIIAIPTGLLCLRSPASSLGQ